METNKILSFEEFSTKTTDTATVDTATSTVDTTADTTTDTVDTDTTDTTTDTVDTDTETTDTTETEEETEDVEESDAYETKKVTEMLGDLKEMMITEAKAWEADEYDEHTVESYLKENSALYASMVTNTLEEIKSTDESYTKEAYESTCNELKEAYSKRCDEAYESYGASESNTENEVESQEDAVIANPAK